MPWPLIVGAAAALGGGLLSANSASKAAKAQNQAAQDAEQMYNQQTLMGMARQAMALYGGEGGQRYLQGALPREQYDYLFGRAAQSGTLTESERTRMADLERRIGEIGGGRGGGGWMTRQGVEDNRSTSARRNELEVLQKELQALQTKAGGDRGVTAALDVGAYQGQGGYLSKMNDLASTFEGKGTAALRGFNADTQRLLRGSRQIEQGAAGFGDQERKRINRDADTALTGANRAALARLAASGLADSTLTANQYGENSRLMENMRQDQLGALGDRQINLLTGLRQNTLGMDNQRSTLGSQMRLGLNDQSLALRQAPLQTEIGVLTGNAFNPYLNQNTTQYFPGASSGAAAGATFGNALGAVGGQLANYGMMQYGQQQAQQQGWQGIPYAR
jgi:hypothetical protein